MIGTTLSDRTAVSTEGIKIDTGVVSGLNMIATRLSPGAISESSSSHLPPSVAAEMMQEVPDLLGFSLGHGIPVADLCTTLPPYPPGAPWPPCAGSNA
jgi:hypothetical protein